MEISGVLFDLYGTLFTYGNMSRAFSLWHEDLARALKVLGQDLSPSKVSKLCKKFFSEPVEEDARYTEYEIRLKRLAEAAGALPDANWIRHTAAISMNRWQRHIPINPETRPLLETLRENGIRIGIISNFQHAPHVRRVLRKNGLIPLLDAIIISGEVHAKKPDPKIFEIALEKLGTCAEKTLFVGDDPKRDILGASSVGMQTSLFQNGSALFPLLDKIPCKIPLPSSAKVQPKSKKN